MSKIKDNEEVDDKSLVITPYSITSYGADYTIDSLVKRLQEEDIFIPPFQRSYVWNINTASKLVESLLLGFPVPGIFLSEEKTTGKLLVIDGQQRLRSLRYFYEEKFHNKRTFELKNVQKQFEGKKYSTLDPADRRRLDNSVIHSTVIKQESPEGGNGVYYIFERLNTGGMVLKSQEIRSCIYYGKLNTLIEELNKNTQWRTLYGQKSEDKNKRDQELILRFIALFNEEEKYEKPMKGWLNKYMEKNRNPLFQEIKQTKEIFEETVNFIITNIGKNAFKLKGNRVHAAFLDSIMIGIATNLTKLRKSKKNNIKEKYNSLKTDERYIASITNHTSDKDKVLYRLEFCKKLFS